MVTCDLLQENRPFAKNAVRARKVAIAKKFIPNQDLQFFWVKKWNLRSLVLHLKANSGGKEVCVLLKVSLLLKLLCYKKNEGRCGLKKYSELFKHLLTSLKSP